MANNVSQTAWAEHLRGCAVVANEIAKILDIREDAARQAMFATVAIDAKNHGVFLEPVPPDTKTPVAKLEQGNGKPDTKASVNLQDTPAARAEYDDYCAEKGHGPTGSKEPLSRAEVATVIASTPMDDVPHTIAPGVAEGARRTAFLAGIESARELLNKEGHVPPVTPKGLCAYITKNFPGKTNLGSLDMDELDRLTMMLSSKLDVLREKKAKETEEAPF